jgi:hypothetical protein
MLTMLSLVACGEHYEGGGRRDKVPTEETSEGPGTGLGNGMSTQGGSAGTAGNGSTTGGGEDSGGAPPFPSPFAGAAGTGGTGG